MHGVGARASSGIAPRKPALAQPVPRGPIRPAPSAAGALVAFHVVLIFMIFASALYVRAALSERGSFVLRGKQTSPPSEP